MKYLLLAASFVLLLGSYLMNRQVKKLKERVENLAVSVNELNRTSTSLYKKLYPKVVYLDSVASKKVHDTMWYASYLQDGDTAWYCCSYVDAGQAPNYYHSKSDEARLDKSNFEYKNGKIKFKDLKRRKLSYGPYVGDSGGGGLVWGGDIDTTVMRLDTGISRLLKKTHSESMYMPRLVPQRYFVDGKWTDTLRILNFVITPDTIYYESPYKDDIPYKIPIGDTITFDGTWAEPNDTIPNESFDFKDHTAKKYYSDSTGEYEIWYDIDMMGAFIPATYPPGKPHYSADIYVYKLLKFGSMKQVGDKIKGTYVQGGCFEDVPANWVKAALKNKPQSSK